MNTVVVKHVNTYYEIDKLVFKIFLFRHYFFLFNALLFILIITLVYLLLYYYIDYYKLLKKLYDITLPFYSSAYDTPADAACNNTGPSPCRLI